MVEARAFRYWAVGDAASAGPMITDQFGDDQALADAFAADTPLKIIGLPKYVATAIVFLLGDESAHVTGAELTVDGERGAD